MVQEKLETVKRQQKIIDKIEQKWYELADKFYVCYDIKELAYKVVYDILNAYNENTNQDITIGYKFLNGKHKIIFQIEENIYFKFDIYWETGFLGDSGLHIGNGTITNTLKKGYNDIENVFQDIEE